MKIPVSKELAEFFVKVCPMSDAEGRAFFNRPQDWRKLGRLIREMMSIAVKLAKAKRS